MARPVSLRREWIQSPGQRAVICHDFVRSDPRRCRRGPTADARLLRRSGQVCFWTHAPVVAGRSPPPPIGGPPSRIHAPSACEVLRLPCVGFGCGAAPLRRRPPGRGHMTTIRQLSRPGMLGVGSLLGVALWLGAIGASTRIEAQSPPGPLSYTVAQADQGRAAYGEHCASCHGENLDDGAYAPPLKGTTSGRSGAGDPRRRCSRIPARRCRRPGRARSATPPTRSCWRYMLQENGSQPGTRELPADPDALKAMASPNWPRGGGGGLAPQRDRAAGAVHGSIHWTRFGPSPRPC